MLGSYEGAMVDQAEVDRLSVELARVRMNTDRAEAGYETGVCVQCGDEMTVTEAPPGYRFGHVNGRNDHLARMWAVDSDGRPVLGEPVSAEQLMASVTVSYERHRSRLRPVRALDIEQMVARFADAVTDRNHAVHLYGFGTPEYERLRRLARWRRAALVRLAEALERQAGGGRELTGEDRAECAHEAAMKRLEDV